ncbi:MAG: 3-isopropylmalate dehydratase large subunit [Proteobacteria bacterium]|nr:3-isopropylmalate dehydratase large subunit [Pseudomonadota bacterium]
MAGLTITEKILARHAGKNRVVPGETVWVDADVLMTHDVCGPGAIAVLKKEIGPDARVWDPKRVVIIPDHFIFTEDSDARRNLNVLREFVSEQGINHFYDAGTECYKGVCHVALAEEGHTRPGEVLFGTDSHTCTAGAFGLFATGIGNTDAAFVMSTGKLWLKIPETIHVTFDGALPKYITAKDLVLALIGAIGVDGATYQTLEFAGPAVETMDMAERMTLCNMAVEAGAKSGIITPDQTTVDFVRARTDVPFEEIRGDADAHFSATHRFDTASLEPQVARPHSPENVAKVSDVAGTQVDCCYIGSCTGGKTEDFSLAAEILDGREVVVDTLCIPATVSVDEDLDTLRRNGRTLREILTGAGARIGPPSCAACLGGPADTLGRLNGSQACISTTNRNFPGRMGSKESSVFLASPYTVAASALEGRITDPRRYL